VNTAFVGGADLAKTGFDTGFNQDLMQKKSAALGGQLSAQGEETRNVFETTGNQMALDFAHAGTQFALDMTQLASAVAKELQPLWDAIVWVGRKAIEGIIMIGKKVGKWVWDHKADIASIAVGILVTGLLGIGLTAIGVPAPIAGFIAGAVGAFVGNEVKQIIKAAENGTLRAPTDFNDFLHMAGEHLKDDAIPVLMGGIGGAMGGAMLGKIVSKGVGKGLGKAFLKMPGKFVRSTSKDAAKEQLLKKILS